MDTTLHTHNVLTSTVLDRHTLITHQFANNLWATPLRIISSLLMNILFCKNMPDGSYAHTKLSASYLEAHPTLGILLVSDGSSLENTTMGFGLVLGASEDGQIFAECMGLAHGKPTSH